MILLKLNIKKIAVSFLAVLLILSLYISFSQININNAYAADNEKKIVKVNGKNCASDEIIVKFKESHSNAKNANTLDSIDPSYKELPSSNTVKIKIPKDKTLEEFLVELNANPDIEFAQPNFIYKLNITVNDPLANEGSDASSQWHHNTINTYEAWDYTMGAGVTVAVLDTGAYVSHEDLGSNITLKPEIALEDTNGDFIGDTSDGADDDDGHGTHVTGIIAATINNNAGGAGIAPLSDVLVYDIFEHYVDPDTGATEIGAFTDDIIIGIQTATADGADIINMSLGGYQDPNSVEYWDVAQKNAVDAAVAAGVIVVCAAGNDGVSDGSPDNAYHSPSDYDSSISVISTDSTDLKSSFSNYGPSKDISAPGGAIYSTTNDGSYASWNGTSMASPVVAGVCALILSADPTLTVDEVKNILYTTADDLGATGRDDTFGWGRINAERAVLMALDRVIDLQTDSSIEVELGHTDTIGWTITPSDATNKNITWTSSNESVATVSTDGTVTGVSLGSATITSVTEDGGYTDTCDVTVVPVAVNGVSLNKSTSEIIIGQGDTLTATVAPSDAANKNITWTSSNTAVATVVDGVITSVSTGTTTITVTTDEGSFTDTCDVTVIPIPVSGVSINKPSTSLYEGASELLNATVSPDNAANKNVTWTSSNSSVATVDSSGMITAVSAGTATITVTTESGGHTDTCTVTVSSLTPASLDETIRVKLSINNPTYIYFYVDGNYTVAGGSGDALTRQQYHIDLDNGVLKLYYGNTLIHSGSTITLNQHTATTDNNYLWIDNYEYGPTGYLGDMVFSISSGAIQAVNHVYLEEYLYGVVPYEMSDSWPIEALKAQAIAARTYAAANMDGVNYDVVDTSSDQVYRGYNATKANAISAVDATAKKILQYGDVIMTTYYSASNGGYTDIPYHAWGSGYSLPFAIYEDPYDVANTYSPYEKIFFPAVIDGSHPITVSDNVDGTPNITNAVAYIKQRILASGQLGGGVTSVSQFELTGVLELVPHTYDIDGSEDHSRVPASGANDCIDYVMATGRFNVSVGGGANQQVTGIELDLRYFDAANGISTYKVFNMSALRLFVIEGDESTGWAIYQRRYGHGVGMSQRGAQQRANSGQTYSDILSFYYPSTSRVDLSYTQNALTSNASTDTSNAEVVCNDYLNVRTGPGTSYSVVGTLPDNARIEIITAFVSGGDWHQITFGGASAYVHSDYVTQNAYVAPTSVVFDETSITLGVGIEQILVSSVLPANASNKNVSFTSDNPSVATVDQTGKVTAIADGSATITVTTDVGGHTDTCDINVIIPVTGVSLDKSSATIYIGKTETLTATIDPSNATNKAVTWSSNNEAVATVADGIVTAVAEGSATITVTTDENGFTDTCAVTVSASPTDAIYSSVYTVDQTNSLLLGVPDEITLQDMIANLNNSADDIVIIGLDTNEITDLSTFAGTGMKVQLVNGSVVDELDIVILGDIDGNGLIDIIDYTYVKLDIFDVLVLNANQTIAGDIDKSGAIDILDYTYIKLDIFDVLLIN